MRRLIPIAKPEFTKTAVEDPLLEVPPARRGNRVDAPCAVPLAKRGEPEGGGRFMNSERAIGITTPRSASARAGCRDSPSAHAPPTSTSR
jgi:hypothetical protein